MDKHEFQLSDGSATAKVVSQPESKDITITFDVRDTDNDAGQMDMDKYRSAVTHLGAIRETLQHVGENAQVPLPEMKDGKVTLRAHFATQPDFETALALVHAMQLRNPNLPYDGHANIDDPSLLDMLREQFKEHPEDAPAVAPTVFEENTGTHAFLERISGAKENAQQKNTLKVWSLENADRGMVGAVFPLEKSAITGKPTDQDKLMLAIRVVPGNDTENPRHSTYRMTNEIEKRLMIKGLGLKAVEVHHGKDADGKNDTGLILVQPDSNPLKTLDRINEIMEAMQGELQIISMKRGTRYRGEDHYHAPASKVTSLRPAQPESDPIADAIASSIKTAESSGLIKINGTYPEMGAWVSELATEIRQRLQGQQPPRRQGGQGK